MKNDQKMNSSPRTTAVKESRTYGAIGFIDYEALIPVGRGRIRVSFTDGSMTGMGTSPASFTTSNPFLQTVIERSPQFRSGRIVLLHSEKLREAPSGGAEGAAGRSGE